MVLVIYANPSDRSGYPFIRQRPRPRRIHVVLWCAALCLQRLGTDDLKHQSQRGAHHSHEERVFLPVYIHSPLMPQGADSQLAGQDKVNPGKRVSYRHSWPNTAVLFQYRQMLRCKGRGSKDALRPNPSFSFAGRNQPFSVVAFSIAICPGRPDKS